MDEDDFKSYLRVALFIFACTIGAVLGVMLLIVAGWEVKAHVDKISPDPPRCTYVDTQGYGRTTTVVNDPPKDAGDAGR